MNVQHINSETFVQYILDLEKKKTTIAATALLGLEQEALIKLIKSHLEKDSNVIVLAPAVYGIEELAKVSNKSFLKINENTEIPLIDTEKHSDQIFDEYQVVFFDPDYPENPTEEQDANFKEKQLIPNIFDKIENTTKHTLIIIQEDFICSSEIIKRIYAVHRRFKGSTIVALLSNSSYLNTSAIIANANINAITVM